MVGRRPASPTQLPTIGNTSFHLGVIVDTTTYGSEDELSLSNDVPSVIEEEGSLSDGGGVVRIMRNGKVKRKLRWKPPNFRRKKNNVSSNMSVVSSLTNRSTGTNRSTSTSRSFLSHFSRKSQSSFHTFHSTATPVANNKKNSPQPHVLQRPNYPDTFDAKHATIDNEGRHVLKKMGSGNLLGTVNEVAVFERSSTLPSRLDGMAMSPRSPMTEASTVKFFDPYGGTSASIASDPFDSLEPDKPEPIVKPEKPKRPPLFRLRKAKERPPSPEEASKDSSTNNSSTSPVGATYTAPTISSSGSPLSPQSLEGENSVLPVLETETYEEDRRVALTIGTPPRSQQDYSDHTGDNAPRGSAPLSPKSHHSSPSSTPSRSVVKITDKIEKSPTGPTIQKPSTTPDSLRPPLPVTASVGRQTPSPSCRASPHKRYNRPVDSMSAPPQSVLMTSGEDGTEAQQAEPQRRQRPNTTVPVDVDAGAFLEAEHNLKAIHDMAAEHLAHGEYEEATEVFEEILRGQQERYGQNHYRVGTALHNLGIVHLKAGDFERAIDVCGQAVEVRKESLVPNHPDAAVSLAQLGVAYLESQNYDQALVAFREALHIRRNFLGPRHLKCSKILNKKHWTYNGRRCG
jgi:TolA-binding protein